MFNTLIDAINVGKSGVFFFLYWYDGIGKTCIWKALTSFLQSKGRIVLIVASNGIASTLLPRGRIAHSKFAILIEINEDSTCNIRQGSAQVELLKKIDLII